ncbi:MAG: hypothetical protein K5697_15735 [Lachnospiraceae bacterium]|nr:hypothetical protein [Lachnospiraceae bacterium]
MRRIALGIASVVFMLCACGEEEKPAGAEGTATPTPISYSYATEAALRAAVSEKELTAENWSDYLGFTEVEDDREIGEEKLIQYRELYVLTTAGFGMEVSEDFSATFSYTGDWIIYYRNPDTNEILWSVPGEPGDYSDEKEIRELYTGGSTGELDRVYTGGGVDTIYNEGHAVVEEIREIQTTELKSIHGKVRFCEVPQELWNSGDMRFLLGKGGGSVYRYYEDGRLFKSSDPAQEGEEQEPSEGYSPFMTFLSLID